MLVPHNPSKHLHSKARDKEQLFEDVLVVEVPGAGDEETVRGTRSGRTEVMNRYTEPVDDGDRRAADGVL